MVVGKTIETYRHGTQTVTHKFGKFFIGKQHSVCHHSPDESAFGYGTTALGNVGTHKRLATSSYHHDVVRGNVGFYIIEHFQKIVERHVLLLRNYTAIASAVTAVEITAQSAFPEKLVQMMFVGAKRKHRAIQFERKPFV
jgi:hypothetical protein